MQSTYRATFEVPALVEIELELSADNQQDALVNAHDLILLAKPTQAKVTSLRLESAKNVDLERVDSGTHPPTPAISPHEVTGQHTVTFFRGKCAAAGEAALSLPALGYVEAKAMAESVRNVGSFFGFAQVHDQLGNVVLSATAPRGGWEAEAYLTAGGTEMHSWLPERRDAMNTLMQLLRRADVESVKVFDYTDRKTGPRFVREVR